LIAQTAFQIGALYQAMGSGAMKEDGRKRYYQNAYEFLNKAKSIWKDMGNTYQLNQVEKIVSLVR
jgi:hypothetical protein